MSQHIKTLLVFITFLFFGCTTDPTPSIEEEFNIPVGVKEPLIFEYLIHDVEGIVFNMLYSLHERDKGQANTHIAFNVFSGRGTCANQTLDADGNELVLDFSVGCIDDSERLRSGIIKINYTDPEDGIGNMMTIHLNQFKINNLELDGSLSIENVSTVNSGDEKGYSISFSNLSLNVNTETSSFTGNRQIHYEKVDGNVFETTELTYLTSSNFSFTLQNGNEYTVSTPTALSHAFSCWQGYTYFPFSGKQIIEGNNSPTEIEYIGCDYTFEFKTADDEIWRFDLNAIL
ncbi:MAG: hypothetical protein HWE21_08735 [Cytophagia bacterium]|nr:hypothetical protein [Cytophagia bacterium]